jgi:pimeloyl-ACP methyl ester carboxylesterase
MRKLFCFFILDFVINTTESFSQDNKKFVGAWEGKLNVGVELRIVIHIKAGEGGDLSSTLDSPDQSAYGIAADTTTVHDNELHFTIDRIHVSFTGKLESDSVIAGTFSQNKDFPLTLKKTDNPTAPPRRPQTPQPPFPYKVEDVEYGNADRSVHFSATLTYPDSEGPFVTAILISGSGQQDRDETIFGHKPFAVIADYLTRNGFAVLRIDDRGIGKTTGEVMKASSADFAKDIMAAMDYLKTRKEVNPKKVGLIGHSEGGLIASLVLVQRKDVAFIISLAGAGMKGSDILADQGELIMIKEGVDEASARSYNSLYKKIIGYSLSEKDSAECFNKVWQEYTKWQSHMKPEQLNKLGFTNEETAKEALRNLLKALYLPWMQFFNSSDASVNYQKAYCPVLALNGSEDVQVIAKKNLEEIRSALKKSKSKHYEVKELPGLNHLFQHCTKCGLSEYGTLEETFAPEALKIMGDWLNENVR